LRRKDTLNAARREDGAEVEIDTGSKLKTKRSKGARLEDEENSLEF